MTDQNLWYRNQIDLKTDKLDFQLGDVNFYRVNSDELKLHYKYPNVFRKGKISNAADVRGLNQLNILQSRFYSTMDEAKALGFGGTCSKTISSLIENIFDKDKLRKLLGFNPDLLSVIDIDFENKEFAHLYLPLTPVIKSKIPKTIVGDLERWFPICYEDISYRIVGRFDLLTFSFGKETWLCKAGEKKPKKTYMSAAPVGMLAWMLQKT